MTDLAETFDRYFDVVEANTPALINEAQALRYQVYCLERSFEDGERFIDGRERDEFDDHSVHSVVRCRSSQQFVGVVRLVLTNPARRKFRFAPSVKRMLLRPSTR